MNREHDLAHALASADAASPPPPATAITAATLRARLQRRRLQRALLVTSACAAGAIAFAVLRAPAAATAPRPTIAALRAQLVDLRARLDALDEDAAELHERQRRGDLAALRARAAIDQAPLAFAQFTVTPLDHATTAPQGVPSPTRPAGRAATEDHR